MMCPATWLATFGKQSDLNTQWYRIYVNHHTLATLGTLTRKNTNYTLCVERKANNSIVMTAHLKKKNNKECLCSLKTFLFGKTFNKISHSDVLVRILYLPCQSL